MPKSKLVPLDVLRRQLWDSIPPPTPPEQMLRKPDTRRMDTLRRIHEGVPNPNPDKLSWGELYDPGFFPRLPAREGNNSSIPPVRMPPYPDDDPRMPERIGYPGRVPPIRMPPYPDDDSLIPMGVTYPGHVPPVRMPPYPDDDPRMPKRVGYPGIIPRTPNSDLRMQNYGYSEPTSIAQQLSVQDPPSYVGLAELMRRLSQRGKTPTENY